MLTYYPNDIHLMTTIWLITKHIAEPMHMFHTVGLLYDCCVNFIVTL